MFCTISVPFFIIGDVIYEGKRNVLLLALPCTLTLLIAFIIPMVYTFIKALINDNQQYVTERSNRT